IEILLTALTDTLGEWNQSHSLLIDIEGHGREEIFEEIDLARTIGWFTTVYRLHLDLSSENSIGGMLKKVKEHMRRVPNRGIGYGLLKYLCEDHVIREQLSNQVGTDVIFNYLGQYNQQSGETKNYSAAKESSGAQLSPLCKRRYLIGVNGWISDGQ